MTFWTFYVDRGDGAKLRIWVIQRDPEGDPQFLKDEFLKWKLTVVLVPRESDPCGFGAPYLMHSSIITPVSSPA